MPSASQTEYEQQYKLYLADQRPEGEPIVPSSMTAVEARAIRERVDRERSGT